MLVSTGQMRQVQLLLDQLKEPVYSKEGPSLNIFPFYISLTHTLYFCLCSKQRSFICDFWRTVLASLHPKQQEANTANKLQLEHQSLLASISHISTPSLSVSSISDSLLEVRKWLLFRTQPGPTLAYTHMPSYKHTYTQSAPGSMRECQVSSSAAVLVAVASSSSGGGSSTVWLWRPSGTMFTGLPQRQQPPLLCGMCQCGNKPMCMTLFARNKSRDATTV